jgi:hypothetical protein
VADLFLKSRVKKEAHFDERRSPSSALQAPVVIPMAARDRAGVQSHRRQTRLRPSTSRRWARPLYRQFLGHPSSSKLKQKSAPSCPGAAL